MASDIQTIYSVQRAYPFGPLGPRKTIVLPIERIHPVIRIAHLQTGPSTPQRIIFDHELFLVLSGHGRFVIGDTEYEFSAHDLFFVPPFTLNSMEAFDEPRFEHIAIHFDFARGIPPLTEEVPDRAPYQVTLTHSLKIPQHVRLAAGDRIEQAIIDIVREFHSTVPTASLSAATLLAEVLVGLLRLPTVSPDGISAVNRDRVARVVAFVQQNIARKLPSTELAAVAGLSMSRLNTLFRLIHGVSPHEYILRMRVQEARRLLADGAFSIKEIAAMSGFEDAFHFSKVFRRFDGLSPTRYRDAVLRDGSHSSIATKEEQRRERD